MNRQNTIKCPKCGHENPTDVYVCQVCKLQLRIVTPDREVQPPINTTATNSNSDRSQQVNAVDASENSPVAIGNNAKAINVQPGAVYSEPHTVVHTTFAQQYLFLVGAHENREGSIYPRRRDQLEWAVTIGEKATVQGFIHCPGRLVLQDGVYISGSVYSRGAADIGRECTIGGSLIGLDSVDISDGTHIKEGILSASDRSVRLGNGCHVDTVIRANGHVILGDDCHASLIATMNDVRLGDRCTVQQITGNNVWISSNCRVGNVNARGSLHLGESVRVDWCSIPQSLEVGHGVRVMAMDTLVAHMLVPGSAFPIFLRNQMVTQQNYFHLRGQNINVSNFQIPANPASADVAYIVITNLLTHSLLEVILGNRAAVHNG